ncbi:MAG: MmcQ/YjbR family DNA-binding protein [Oscillibacter sp.]|nr:MmcQ/YjbR family DNA-binding protein [Oscillibacter sp.]
MNIEELREYCLSLPQVTEDMPFDDETLVFKVGGRMFCFASLTGDLKMNLKCDQDEAIEIRETFPAVTPGFHMNKNHWNTVSVDGSISDSMLQVWILRSYKLVVAKLTKAERNSLGL